MILIKQKPVDKKLIFKWYVEEKRSYRWIMKELGINSARLLKKVLNELGIEIRKGGEAVKTQWINNPKRRKEASIRFNKAVYKTRRLPKTEETKEKIRLSKIGEKNPMFGVTGKKHPNFLGGKQTWRFKRKIEKKKRQQIIEQKGNICVRCGSGNKLTINHIIPWRESKSHDLKNLEVLCSSCHFSGPVRLR